jgi:hypothetical protein
MDCVGSSVYHSWRSTNYDSVYSRNCKLETLCLCRRLHWKICLLGMWVTVLDSCKFIRTEPSCGLHKNTASSTYVWNTKASNSVGFEVLTAVVMNSSTFWGITSCSPLKINWSFGGIYLLHLHGRRMSHGRSQHEDGSLVPASFWFLAWLTLQPWRYRLHFSPNFGWLSTEYTKLYPKRYNFSYGLISIRCEI